MIMQGRIKYYAERYKKYQQEVGEKDRTVAHLMEAQEMNAHN